MSVIALNEPRAAEQIRRAIIARRAGLLALIRQTENGIRAEYRAAGGEMRSVVDHHADAEGLIQLSAVHALLRDLAAVTAALKQAEERELKAAIDQASAHGVNSLRKPLEISGVSTSLLATNFEAIRAATVDRVWNEILPDGLKLSNRIWNGAAYVNQTVRDAVVSAVNAGHGARQAALDLIRGGEQLTKEMLAEMGYNASRKIGSDIFQLFTEGGQKQVYQSALTVMRTEMARAYRGAFIESGSLLEFVAGMKWNLSPTHPKPDICDALAANDPDGLGRGCYRTGNYPAFPAHPNCLCFETPVFSWEIKQ